MGSESPTAVEAALGVCARRLIAKLETAELMDELCESARAAFGADFSSLFLATENGEAFEQVATAGQTTRGREELNAVRIPYALVADIAAALNIDNVLPLPADLHERLVAPALREAWGVRSAIMIALRRGENFIGTLTAAWCEPRSLFTEQELALAHGLAGLASLAMENARRFETVTESDRSKTDFVATISHELRTPLNSLLGYAHLLLEEEFGALGEEQRDAVGRIERNAERLHGLIEQILDLGRLERGQLRPARKSFSVSDVANAALAAAAPHRREGIELVVEVVRGQARGDAAKIQIVLTNLLQNAFRYTLTGRVSLRIERHAEHLVATVTDTGVGIETQLLTHVFEPFRQLAPILTREQGGVGLGLHIVKRLTELLQGNVTVESTVGRGSTFGVKIPLEWR